MAGHERHLSSVLYRDEKMGLLEEKPGSSSSSDVGSDDSGDSMFYDIDTKSYGVETTLPWAKYAASLRVPLDSFFSTSWRMLLGRFVMFLIPSFLQGRQMREQIRPAKLPPTAYLDGMRGLAALFVYFCHYSYQSFTIAKGWGFDEYNYHIMKLPFLRLWYQGPPAVSMFFVISGYALSYKALKLARSRNWAEAGNNMSSLVFRRFLRLYLPTAISMLMISILLQVGAYEYTRQFANDRMYMKNVVEPHPEPEETLYLQLLKWVRQMFHYMHFFSWDEYGGQPSLDVHLWTIPIEFRCSLYLFLTIIGTSRLQTKFRWIFVMCIAYFTYLKCRWDLCLFFAGMLIAEMDLIRGAHNTPALLPSDEKTPAQLTYQRNSFARICWGILSIAGLYFMCQPDDGGERTPGWMYLSSLIPDWWFVERYRYWQSIGAVCFMIAVSRSVSWQAFFNSFFIQYLGKISYALYLMHGPAMHVVGYRFESWAYETTGVEGYYYNAGFFLGAAFCVPTVFWWADVFWRAVDIPTVKFARWVEQQCLVK